MAEIERDCLQDRIGTVLWWAILFIFVGIAGVTGHYVITAIVGTFIAYGIYYLITGRMD